MANFLDGTGLESLLTKIRNGFIAKVDTTTVTSVGIDSTPTTNSTNLVTSGGVYSALQGKEDKMDIVAASGTTLSAQVGKYYRFDVPVETLAITLPTMTNVASVKTISFYMTGGTTPAVTFTSSHSVIKPKGFEIEPNGVYEINAAWNGIGWIIGQLTLEAE